MMRRSVLVSVLFLVLAGATWWLAEISDGQEVASDFEGSRKVGYYLRDMTTTSVNKQGVRIRTLYSSKVKHFIDDATTELEKPVLTVYHGQQPPWDIRSENGWVSADGKAIYLTGKVSVSREAGLGVRPVQLDTRNLRIQTEQDYAETDEEVRVRSDGDWLQATGMQAWLRDPAKIKLLNDVTSFYAPPS